MTPPQLVSVLSLLFSLTSGRVVNFEDEGGLPDDFANEERIEPCEQKHSDTQIRQHL